MVEQALDCVACRYVTPDGRRCNDKRVRPTEDEFSDVALALGDAIAGFRATEFSIIDVDSHGSGYPRSLCK